MVGFDAGGPPQGLKIWMDGFIESVKAHPKAAEYVQKIEMDRIASRVGKFNAENPNALRPSDRFRGLEDNPTPEMMSMMDSFIEIFDPIGATGPRNSFWRFRSRLIPTTLNCTSRPRRYDSFRGQVQVLRENRWQGVLATQRTRYLLLFLPVPVWTNGRPYSIGACLDNPQRS